MDEWIRIGDDEFAPFGKHTCLFAFQKGSYSITSDQSDQNYLTIEYQGKKELWHIMRKDKKGDEFKLSGSADWIPEIVAKPYWYELILCNKPTITYWGDRVVHRIDCSLE